MRFVSAARRPRLLVLIASVTATSLLGACGTPTGPSEVRRPAPESGEARALGTVRTTSLTEPTDTTKRQPTLPWY